MTLKIVAKPTFASTVVINTVMVQGTLDVVFVGYPTSELKAIETAAIAAGQGPQQEVLCAVLAGFGSVPMPDGSTLYYTGRDSVLRLLDFPGVLTAIVRRYYDALWEERLGNSEPLPAGSSTTVAAGQPATTSSATTPCAGSA